MGETRGVLDLSSNERHELANEIRRALSTDGV